MPISDFVIAIVVLIVISIAIFALEKKFNWFGLDTD